MAALVVLVFLAKQFEQLELMTHDTRFLLRGYRLASSDVVVVGITPRCIEKLREPPWPRSLYAQAIEELAAAGANVICFDVFFANEADDPQEDARLVEATRRAGNVVFPVFCPVALGKHAAVGPLWHVGDLRTNFPALNGAAAGLGHINIPPALDGKCRMTPLALEHSGYGYLALGIEAASRFLENRARAQGDRHLGRAPFLRDLPVTEHGGFRVNYYGQENTFDLCQFHVLIEGRYPKGLFKDKLVLVGQMSHGLVNADLVTTPLRELFGVFVQGIIIDNILTGQHLKRQSTLGAIAMILLISVVSGWLLFRLSSGQAALVWLGLCASGGVGAMHLFSAYGYLVEFIPCLAVFSGNLAVAITLSIKRSRKTVLHQEVELSTILESSQFSAEEATLKNAPVRLTNLIGRTIAVDCVSLTLGDDGRGWHWVAREADVRKGKSAFRLDIIKQFEKAANPALMQEGRLFLRNKVDAGTRLGTLRIPADSFLSTPLVVRDRLVGLLNLYNKRGTSLSPGKVFTEDDVRLVSVLAQQAALILDNTQLIDELGVRNTDLQDALQQLRATQKELITKEKLSAVGEMASMIIHDMRGPLTAAYGYVSLMQDLGATDPDLADYADRVIKELTRMNQMAQEVLDFSRGTKKLALEIVEAKPLIEEFIERAKSELRDTRITLKADVACTAAIRIDREKILRVLLNLARNAADAMGGQGRITVRCRNDAQKMHFCVSDDGPGIPEDIRENVFKPFVTSGKATGTGLGLAIVRKLVTDHGGSIWVDSEAGKGTSFLIDLPLPHFGETPADRVEETIG